MGELRIVMRGIIGDSLSFKKEHFASWAKNDQRVMKLRTEGAVKFLHEIGGKLQVPLQGVYLF